MKFLYLTPNFEKYTASQYQKDVYNHLKKYVEVKLWGPGFNGFDINLSLDSVTKKFDVKKDDIVCVGHGWLSDKPLTNNISNQHSPYSWMNNQKNNLFLNDLEYCAKYDFKNYQGKKICILNKEYVSLNEKLNFIKNSKFDFVLCHNPHYSDYEKKTNIKFRYWPFAIDKDQINKNLIANKDYDLFFSGLIFNSNISKNKNNLRLKIFNIIYNNILFLKILKKKKYNKFNIVWNSFTGKRYYDLFLKIFHQYKYISNDEYIKFLSQSKSVLNTLGPSDLISPRYFETMACKSIVFAEESELYKELFVENLHYISFKKDLSDFYEKLEYIKSDSENIVNIKKNSYNLVMENHTYDNRAKSLIEWCREI
tara:strand:+ start:4437 stop:5537 length:1101 start_codon:yes stop_codon:yes gene_type:complete